MCSTHYMQVRRGMRDEEGVLLRAPKRVSSYGAEARCSVPECFRRPKGRGLCSPHFQQWRAGVDVGVEVPERGFGRKQAPSYKEHVCFVVGCPSRPITRGMCSKHTQQRAAGILDEEGNQLRPLQSLGRKRKPGPIKDGAGYVLVVAPDGYNGPMRDGRVLEHRLVMEEKLGRGLGPHELVHHINGVKTDNRIENLQLRTRKTHPPAHEMDVSLLEEALQHLKHNDPAAFKALLERITDECPNRPHQEDCLS